MSLYMQYKYTLTHRHTKSKLCVGNAEYGKTDSTILTVTDVLHQSTVSMKPERLENMYNFQSFTVFCFSYTQSRKERSPWGQDQKTGLCHPTVSVMSSALHCTMKWTKTALCISHTWHQHDKNYRLAQIYNQYIHFCQFSILWFAFKLSSWATRHSKYLSIPSTSKKKKEGEGKSWDDKEIGPVCTDLFSAFILR